MNSANWKSCKIEKLHFHNEHIFPCKVSIWNSKAHRTYACNDFNQYIAKMLNLKKKLTWRILRKVLEKRKDFELFFVILSFELCLSTVANVKFFMIVKSQIIFISFNALFDILFGFNIKLLLMWLHGREKTERKSR